MRDIDFINEVVKELAPQRSAIDKKFETENNRFKSLLARDHDAIGRILRAHLILEAYITRHLRAISPDQSWDKARLTFSQKLELLPKHDLKVQWVVPGLREVNKIRNRFGHDIAAEIDLQNVHKCVDVLSVARRGKRYTDAISVIEDFTTVACTWMVVDKDLELIFTEAFARARAKLNSGP